jgi:hypothetical protein
LSGLALVNSRERDFAAVARELLGFIWAIAVRVEQQASEPGRLAA